MAMKHIPDGGDFEFPSEFGFHGSAGAAPRPHHRGRHAPLPEREAEPTAEPLAHGGMAHEAHPHGHHVVRSERHHASGGIIHHHAHGGYTIEHPDGHVTHHHHDGSPVHEAHGGHMSHMHPHGHHVSHVEHHADGRVVHHHTHGGHTVHHPDGRITHHHEDGSPVHAAHGGGIEHMHDESEYAHRHLARGGHFTEAEDERQDKAMVERGIHEHEAHDHKGEKPTALHLRRGGIAGERARLPRGMKPTAERRHSPIETPPRNPTLTATPRNQMPGGEMAYGVEPSDEGGEDQGLTPMRRGGHARRRREHEWE